MASQINTLLDLMYNQLATKKALTYRIKSLYANVKDNYPEYILGEVDSAVATKFSKEISDNDA